MNYSIFKVIIFIYFLLQTPTLYGINFNELVNHTYLNSNELQHKYLDIDIAQEDLNIVVSELYPILNIGYNLEKTNSLDDEHNTNTSIDGNNISNETLKKSYSYININYNLYSFGRVSQKIEVQKQNKESKKYEYCIGFQELILELLKNYYEARTATEKLKIIDDILKQKNEIYLYNNRLFHLGEIDKTSVLNASLDVVTTYNKKLEHSQILNESLFNILRISKTDLSNKILEPLQSTINNENIEFYKTEKSFLLQTKIKMKQAELSFLNKEFLPNVNLYAKYDMYGYDERSYTEAFDNMNSNSYKMGLNISWNIFNGFKTTAQKQKAKLELKKLQHEYLIQKDKFDTQKSIDNHKIAVLNEELYHLEKNVFNSLENQNNINKLYDLGESNKLEWLNKQITRLNNTLEEVLMKEKIAYETIKKEILLYGTKECTVH